MNNKIITLSAVTAAVIAFMLYSREKKKQSENNVQQTVKPAPAVILHSIPKTVVNSNVPAAD